MSELKTAVLDAKYIDMISLGDFVVRDCGLPDADADGNLLPQANEIAAAIFRWAAEMEAGGGSLGAALPAATATPAEDDDDDRIDAFDAVGEEYDEFGDPIMDAEQAARAETASKAASGESA
jgi:hypothetical protein